MKMINNMKSLLEKFMDFECDHGTPITIFIAYATLLIVFMILLIN